MSNPIKVLIACDTFAPDINGAARFAERLAVELERRVAADDEFAEGIRVVQNCLGLGLREHVHHVCGASN